MKEIIITSPEGYEIDKEKSTFEKIVFKKKNIKPRSWEEYCDNFKGQYYYIQDNRDNIATSFTTKGFISVYKNILPSKELAESFLAMIQLISLRDAWIGDWKPDWSNDDIPKWCIVYQTSDFYVFEYSVTSRPLSFQTKEMATDFMNTFKDLFEQAKILL